MTRHGSCRWMVSVARRRPARARLAGVGSLMSLMLFVLSISSTGALLFKRTRTDGLQRQHQPGASSKGGKGKGGKRGKVKEDVAWLLEDTRDGGWEPIRDDGHVQVWKRSMPNSDFVAIKSKASLAVSPQALFEVLTPGDIEIVRQYNPLVEDGNDLEVIDRDNKISWSATTGVWPCRPRDFVTHIQRATLDDGSVAIVNSATTHPKAPAKGQYVRGEILHGVFHIKAAKNKKHSEFTMVHHFNPGGNIPPWLINWLAEGKPITFVRKLEEVARKWDKQAALTKSMPCKGRGFADKPCAFLLPPTDDSQDSDGMGSRAPEAGRGWSAFRTAVTLAMLACCGWVLCFGWPSSLEKAGVARSPAAAAVAAAAPVKVPRKENGTPVDVADAIAHASCATHGAPEATPSLEPPSGSFQEARKDVVVLGEQVVEEAAGESSEGGRAKYIERPNGEVPSEKVTTAAESAEDTHVGGLIGGASASGEKDLLSSAPPPPSAPVMAIAVEIAETPGEDNWDLGRADIAHAVPSAQADPQADPQTPVCAGEVTRKELGTGALPCVEENGGETERCANTAALEPMNGEGEVEGAEVTSAEEAA